MLHLNINSIFSKQYEVNKILDSIQFDIVKFDETKLAKDVPLSFIKNSGYSMLRRDRDHNPASKNGGGGVICIY